MALINCSQQAKLWSQRRGHKHDEIAVNSVALLARNVLWRIFAPKICSSTDFDIHSFCKTCQADKITWNQFSIGDQQSKTSKNYQRKEIKPLDTTRAM